MYCVRRNFKKEFPNVKPVSMCRLVVCLSAQGVLTPIHCVHENHTDSQNEDFYNEAMPGRF